MAVDRAVISHFCIIIVAMAIPLLSILKVNAQISVGEVAQQITVNGMGQERKAPGYDWGCQLIFTRSYR